MDCLRCGSSMRFLGYEKIQLGKTSFATGIWSNIFSGALGVSIYQCSNCGKFEFFSADKSDLSVDTSQRICPQCGFEHDFDCSKCPKCGFNYFGDSNTDL